MGRISGQPAACHADAVSQRDPEQQRGCPDEGKGFNQFISILRSPESMLIP